MAKKRIFKINQTPEQLAYLAGIIDGEGCFYIGQIKQGKYGIGQQWHVLIKITSCDISLIKWLRSVFTGISENRYRWTAKKAFYRPVYSWTISGESMDYLLPKIFPYLVIKKRHCETMIEIRKTFKNWGSRRLPEEVIKKRVNLMKKMRKLNSRFHNHAFKQK